MAFVRTQPTKHGKARPRVHSVSTLNEGCCLIVGPPPVVQQPPVVSTMSVASVGRQLLLVRVGGGIPGEPQLIPTNLKRRLTWGFTHCTLSSLCHRSRFFGVVDCETENVSRRRALNLKRGVLTAQLCRLDDYSWQAPNRPICITSWEAFFETFPTISSNSPLTSL